MVACGKIRSDEWNSFQTRFSFIEALLILPLWRNAVVLDVDAEMAIYT